MKHFYLKSNILKTFLIGIGLLIGGKGFAQIGGNTSPLQYSVHTFSVEMDDVAYISTWGVYPSGTDATAIENGTATPLVNGTHYTLLQPVYTDAGFSYFEIQFSTTANGPLATGGYVIGYKETTSDGNLCVTALTLDITVYGPFDVDVALNDAGDDTVCPDDSGDPKEAGELSTQTTIEYLVDVIYPGAGEGGYEEDNTWTFSFEIDVDGAGSGTNGTIAGITASGTGMTDISWGAAVGSSNYNGSCTVDPSQVDPITFSITFNDVLGVNQNITFRIYDIQGTYQEPDIDEVNGTSGNSLTHTIYNMPDVGAILAWN